MSKNQRNDMQTQGLPLRLWVADDVFHSSFKNTELALLEKALICSETEIVENVTSHFIITHPPEMSTESVWIVEDLGTGPVQFKHGDLLQGSLHPFGICKTWILAYFVSKDQGDMDDLFGGSNDAKLYLLDRCSLSVELLGTWDLNLRGLYTSRHGPKVAHLGCAISCDEKWGIVLGPGSNFRGPSNGCTVMNTEQKCFSKSITIPGFMKVAMAAFNPRPEHCDVVCLVCCRRHEICTDYSRPNTSGELVVYNISSSEVLQCYSENEVSSEILKYSPDGDFILTRSNKKKAILLFDSETLILLHSFSHDVSKFRPNHFAFTSLYNFFPLFSASSSTIAIMNCFENLPFNAVNCDIGSRRVRSFQNVYINMYDLPVIRVLSLKSWCRRSIRVFATDDEYVLKLPLPHVLLNFLLWKI